MTRIGIVTDSSCDLPYSVVDSLGITGVPRAVRFASGVVGIAYMEA
jgi:fatty acid-binding protein DegV